MYACYVCMYTHTIGIELHTCLGLCIYYTYMHIQLHINKHTYVCSRIGIYIYICRSKCMYVYLYTYICTDVYICICIYVHIMCYIYVCICMYTHGLSNACMLVHTCICAFSLFPHLWEVMLNTFRMRQDACGRGDAIQQSQLDLSTTHKNGL